MATSTPKALFRGAASTGSTTLYTVPASTTAIITNIIVTNTAGVAGTYTLSLDGVVLAQAAAVPANDSIVLDIKQVLATTKTITGLASATTINFHISGVELT